MSWVAVAVGGASIAGSVISSSQAAGSAEDAAAARAAAVAKFQKQYQQERDQAVNGTFLGDKGLTDIFGTRPDAALYDPVNFDQSLSASILGNQGVAANSSALIDATNQANARSAQQRISSLLPGYSDSLGSYSGATQALLRGELPFDDVMGIVSNRSELGGSLGTPGTSTNATLKDLGLSRLQAQQQGGSMFQSILGSLNQNVDPTQNLFSAQSNYLTPGARLSGDMEQAQLNQQSQQSANFLKAGADPGVSGIFNTDLSVNSSALGMQAGAQAAAAGVNTGLPWGQILSTVGGTIGKIYGNPGTASSGYSSPWSYQGGGGSFNPSGYNISARPDLGYAY